MHLNVAKHMLKFLSNSAKVTTFGGSSQILTNFKTACLINLYKHPGPNIKHKFHCVSAHLHATTPMLEF